MSATWNYSIITVDLLVSLTLTWLMTVHRVLYGGGTSTSSSEAYPNSNALYLKGTGQQVRQAPDWVNI